MVVDDGLASFSCILYSLWLILGEERPAAREEEEEEEGLAERLPAAVRRAQRYATAHGRV